MLRTTLIWIGALCFTAGLLLAIVGINPPAMPLLAGGAFLSAAMLFERWRYRRVPQDAPRGQPTGERFIDPETQKLVEVYYDPATGQRSYVWINEDGSRRT